MPFQRVAIVGSREFHSADLVPHVLSRLLEQNGPFAVISGAAQGVDSLAAKWGNQNNLEVVEYPADWANDDKSAGVKRNAQIIGDCDCVLAFWDGISVGTADSIKRARKAGLPLQVFLG